MTGARVNAGKLPKLTKHEARIMGLLDSGLTMTQAAAASRISHANVYRAYENATAKLSALRILKEREKERITSLKRARHGDSDQYTTRPTGRMSK